MENVFKITRKILALAIFFIGFQYGTAQSDFFVYKVSGEPYIEVNDSIKSVTKGSVLNKDTSLTMNRNDIIHFIDEKGDMYELYSTGKFNHADLQKVPILESNTTFMRKMFSYLWKEFTNTMASRNNKSGVVYRGDEIILMRYPADSITVFSGEVHFEWEPIEGKEKDYYFILRDVESKQLITIATPSTSLGLMVDGNLLQASKTYEWTITETKYPNLKKTPFYSFKLLTQDEFAARQNEIKEISKFLKQIGLSKTEIREAICQDYKICY